MRMDIPVGESVTTGMKAFTRVFTRSNPATVAVAIAAVNDPPVAANDAVGTGEDQAVTIVVLFNDSDVDGNLAPSTVTVVNPPVNGSTTEDQVSGEIRYTPNQDFNGLDTFIYTVDDNNGGTSNPAIVNVVVTDQNDAPVAANDSTSTNEDTLVLIVVLANDSDVDGTIDSTAVSVLTSPANGSTTVDPGT